MGTKLTILAVSIGLFCGSMYAAYLHGRSTATAEIESEQAKQHNRQWSELFALQGQLATRDLQLAEEQQKKAQVRTVKVIEKEVVYREKIKDADTAKCIIDSGLLELIYTSHGIDGAKHTTTGTSQSSRLALSHTLGSKPPHHGMLIRLP